MFCAFFRLFLLLVCVSCVLFLLVAIMFVLCVSKMFVLDLQSIEFQVITSL